jgi:hypothetical protein
MSVTNSPTSTLSNYSNLSDENGQNKNETEDYLDSANISKRTQSFEISDGIILIFN